MDRRVEVVKGSPATLIVDCGSEAYLVDPGHGKKRAKQLAKKIAKTAPDRLTILVTHYHSDHLNTLSQGLLQALEERGIEARVVAPARDAPGIVDPLLRVTLTFGLPLHSESPLLSFDPLPARVDQTIEPPATLGPLQVIPLPGHTPGQVGVIAPDGTLYAADSVFGTRVLERYAVPYHLDPCQALQTLETLEQHARQGHTIQPSHGPPASGDEALTMIQANKSSITSLLDNLQKCLQTPKTLEEAAACAIQGEPPPQPGLALLVQTAVRGALACLHKENLIKAITTGPATIKWNAQFQVGNRI